MFSIITSILVLASLSLALPTKTKPIARPAGSTINDAVSTNETFSARAQCPSNIANGPFEFPRLIIPTDKSDPKHAPGTQYIAEMSETKTTIFNFDIPVQEAYNERTCALIFMFPYKSDISPGTIQYEWSGMEAQEYSDGGLNFARLEGPADEATNYENTPKVAENYGKTKILPGNAYTIAKFRCPTNERIAFAVSSVGKCDLKFFESQQPEAPQGLFVVPCSN